MLKHGLLNMTPGYLKRDERMTSQEKRQQYYREKYKTVNPAWDDTMIRFHKMFGEIVKPGVSLLDLGCGRGNVIIDDYKPLLKEAVGIDVDHSAVEGNGKLDRIDIGNVERLPYPDSSFDIVISQWVIEHLGKPDAVFSECYRVLKPGGHFLFVTPYKNSSILFVKRFAGSKLTKRILKMAYGRGEDDVFETTYKANTVSVLHKKLERAGFTNGTLIQNPDPSYWAFNEACFRIAVFFEKYFSKWTTMHLVGCYQKEKK